MASSANSTVVMARALRKLRTRSCSRSAAELAPRTAVTMLPRSSPTILILLARADPLSVCRSGCPSSVTPSARLMRSNSWRRGSVGTQVALHVAEQAGHLPEDVVAAARG